jgi:hypothetical protein
MQRHQGFNILCIPGEERELTIGTKNALFFPPESTNVPAFIAPESGPIDKLEESKARLILEIYRMSCVTYTQQYATEQSGESKKWTFHITRQELEDFAVNCEYAEIKMMQIFDKYTNSSSAYNTVYNKNYGVEDINEDLLTAIQALEVNFGTEGNRLVRQKAARAYFADEDEVTIKAVEQSIDDEVAAEGNVNDGTDNNTDEN